jgi:hypothetical protein
MSIEEWKIQEIQKAIKEADAGLFASDEDIMKLKKKLGVTE